MQQLEAPGAWPNTNIKCEGHGPVSHGGKRGSRREHGWAGSNCINELAGAASQSQVKLWPTCRLSTSPEAGPGATIGTLIQGYPLLRYEGVVPMRRSLTTR
jgi:hypothetical protein